MSQLEVVQIPCLSDNYGYLVHDSESKLTASIDSPALDPIEEALRQNGWVLTHIFNTHHHYDHTGANLELKKRWKCKIIGSDKDSDRIPGLDEGVNDQDIFSFGNNEVKVFDVSGHTIGHISFYFPGEEKLFCGDALFALGCGRIFEGTPAQMWESLQKLEKLPEDTKVYCAHEYTLANANFAVTVEPQNKVLLDRVQEIKDLRNEGKPTIPSTIGLEKSTNPFLRPMSKDIQANLDMLGAELVDVFAETRRRKDNF